ncbi:ABC-2 type transporter [Planifilum fulgidum]|jgi:ABC-2 type transport system permease protein|uniref:ABC-2 type transporter n=1 Tax=Planifilum fulgidum TaxID=201973 RepID=A0A1I2STY8_9BACL|nr:ABC-2 type transporter [Planifilum fulgidum]
MMLGAHMLCGAFVFLVSALILTVFGWAFYEEAPKYPESVAAALLPSILALFPSGMFVTSLARDNRSAAAIGFLLLNRMLFLSGATFSTERMPSYLPTSAKILPPASWWNCLHKTWNKATLQDKSVHVAVLAAIANVSGIPAARFFRREDCAFLGPGPGSVDKQNNALYNIFLAVRRS